MPATASRTVPFPAFANTPHDVAVPSAIHASRNRRSDTPTPVRDPYRAPTHDPPPPGGRPVPVPHQRPNPTQPASLLHQLAALPHVEITRIRDTSDLHPD